MTAARLSHAAADYEDRGSITQHCSLCTMFRGNAVDPSCTLVRDIDWFGICKFFKKRGKDDQAS